MVAQGYPLLGVLGQTWLEVDTTQEALKKSIPDKWQNENPHSTSSSINTIWHKAQDRIGSNFALVNYSQGGGSERMAWTNFNGD